MLAPRARLGGRSESLGMVTFAELLRLRGEQDAARPAFTALGPAGEVTLDYRTLDERAGRIAAGLRARGAAGRPVLLVLDGLDFVLGLFGCLAAGAIAVPAAVPGAILRGRLVPRLRGMIADARPALIVEAAGAGAGALAPAVPVVGLDELEAAARDDARPAAGPGEPALLQYTSGSTGDPRGVVVTHGNLAHNQAAMQRAFGHDARSVIVSWLPLHHDMGLGGTVLQTVFAGARAVLLSPAGFLRRPVRWLEAITRFGGTSAGAPDFAYELCASRITDDERRGLALGSWRIAASGAEPVRAETLARFADRFAPCGFDPAAFRACYGLAEATLFVSGGAPVPIAIDGGALGRGRVVAGAPGGAGVRTVVACGPPAGELRIALVDPDAPPGAATEVGRDRVGELWIAGPSVAAGYWRRPDDDGFAGRLRGDDARFLRTGDLGFVADGRVVITGRCKDLIIVRGVNHYPQDLERTAAAAHAGLRAGAAAAFAIDAPGGDGVGLVQEVGAGFDAADAAAAIAAIRRAVAAEHELACAAIALVRPGAVPRTTSGKVQRAACGRALAAGALAVIASWRQAAGRPEASDGAPDRGSTEAALAAIWREVLGEAPGRDDDVLELGVDSLQAAQLAARIERDLGVAIDAAGVVRAGTIAGLAAAIEGGARGAIEGGARAAIEGGAPGAAVVGASAPLSAAQRPIWFMEQVAGGAPLYHIGKAVRIRGRLDPDRLERALAAVIDRHDALRTRVIDGAEGPVQVIGDGGGFALERGAAADLDLALARARALAVRPFDLAAALPIRAGLFALAADDHLLAIAVHHLVADGWSMGIVLGELSALYRAAAERPHPAADGAHPAPGGAHPPAIAAPAPSAIAIAAAAAARLDGERARALRYWTGRLAGAAGPALVLPGDRPPAPDAGFGGATLDFVVPEALTAAIGDLARELGVTPFAVLLAGFATVLHRVTGEDALRIGSPVANRPSAAAQATVGCLVNTVVLRLDAGGDPPFRALIGQAAEVVAGALAHQALPFDEVIAAVQPHRDGGQLPLLDAGLVLQGPPPPGADLGGLELAVHDLDTGTSKLDLTVFLSARDGALAGQIEYRTARFDPATARRWADRLVAALRAGVAAPATRLSALACLAPDELAIALRAGRAVAGPGARCLAEIVEDQVRRSPDAIALCAGDERLRYDALDARANRLAHRLRAAGVGPEVRVAIHVDRSAALIVAVLAVAKAGGAYVPLDPGFPAERLAMMLVDAAPAVLITDAPGALDFRGPTLTVDDDPAAPAAPLPATARPGHLAYVIFTSGSTGRPKGVMVSHGNLASGFAAWRDFYRLDEVGPGYLQLASFSFDVFGEDLLRALGTGKRLVLAPRALAVDPAALVARLIAEDIRFVELVPSMLREVIRHLEATGTTLPSVEVVVCGSDAWTVGEHRRFRRSFGPDTRLINSYGMSEATIDNAGLDEPPAAMADHDLLPTGQPFANTALYVLDRHLRPAPIGAAGEIAVGGGGVARGYHGRPGLTADKFVPSPFPGQAGQRLYRSGDQGRLRADGSIEFLGRRDHRVKVRGVLVELGEVEAALRRTAGVADAIAVARTGADRETVLVAYVTADAARLGPASVVAQWTQVFDDLYATTSPDYDPAFYIKGWDSAYTNTPMPDDDVRAWMEQSVERVRALAPRAVLELGCGSGLTMFRIAPACARYVASDLSPQPLRFLREQLAARADGAIAGLELVCRGADDFTGVAPGEFDTVLSISALQYFPDLDYLDRVIDGALDALAPGGAIYLGDVRNLDLLDGYAMSVQLAHAPPGLPIGELARRIGAQLRGEKQLVISPDRFHRLAADPRVAEVQVLLQRGRRHNELTKFRYDVVIRRTGGAAPPPGGPREWIDWGAAGLTVETLAARLAAERPAWLGLTGIPNARLAVERAGLAALASAAPATAGELVAATAGARDGVDPEALWRLGATAGYTIVLGWPVGARGGAFTAVLRRDDQPARAIAMPPAGPPATVLGTRPGAALAVATLAAEVRDAARRALPAFMVPAQIEVLDAMPVSPNGKIDRRALEQRPWSRAPAASPTRARTPIEATLLELWGEVLGVDGIGVTDNWFELGGHSLLATRLIARVRQALAVELPLRAVFEQPTIERLARVIADAPPGRAR